MKKTIVLMMTFIILFSVVSAFTDNVSAETNSTDNKLLLVDNYGALSLTDGYITGITEKQNACELINFFITPEKVSISRNGVNLAGTSYVGTGNVVHYTDLKGNVTDSAEAVVLGDMNSDGKITTADYIIIKKQFDKGIILKGAYFKAADIDGNDRITTSDYLRIRKYFNGTYELYTYTSYLWEKDTDGYMSYRIPGIVTTKNGTLIAYCEARLTSNDWANIDILMRRSTDGGKTWSESLKLSRGIPSGTRNNPVMIVDSNNKIHMMISYQYGIPQMNGKVYYLCSEDDGITWSKPKDISAQTNSNTLTHAHFACGPSHGIELKDGTLIFPFWFVYSWDYTTNINASPSYISTLYSKDGGSTWQVGEVLYTVFGIQYASEPAILQLSTGEVMLNVRIYSEESSVRGVAVSPDGISDWSLIMPEEQLPDPFCQGSLVRYDNSTILFTNCNSRYSLLEKDRYNLTIRYSKDDGETWSNGTVVCESDSMYSDMTVRNGIIYVVYEEGFYDGLSINVKRYRIEDVK